MSIPKPTSEEIDRLIGFLAAGKMLKDRTTAGVAEATGNFQFELSERGVKCFVALYRHLMIGPDHPNNAGVFSLLWILDCAQKQHFPEQA